MKECEMSVYNVLTENLRTIPVQAPTNKGR